MVSILNGKLVRDDITSTAMGGTELIATEMVKRIDTDLLSKFNIIHSRVREYDKNKKTVYVCHDLPGDPESNHLAQGGYNKFDRIVFVSNWQMQRYIDFYGIPWYKCVVLHNAIEPIDIDVSESYGQNGKEVKLIYHTTPHRGLDILLSAFDKLSQEDDNITLDLYSSFKIYGWGERDEQYKDLFAFADAHPKITNHGSVSNEEVREALKRADIFAYPSKWPETSCLALIEAMSAGCMCVHSNYAALPETAANWTMMYQYMDSVNDHTKIFYANLKGAVASCRKENNYFVQHNAKAYIDLFYNWDTRAMQWTAFLKSLL